MLSKRFLQVEDSRNLDRTEYSLHDFFMTGFAMMYFQDPSLLTFQRRLQKAWNLNNLKTMFNHYCPKTDFRKKYIVGILPVGHG